MVSLFYSQTFWTISVLAKERQNTLALNYFSPFSIVELRVVSWSSVLSCGARIGSLHVRQEEKPKEHIKLNHMWENLGSRCQEVNQEEGQFSFTYVCIGLM